MAFHKQDHISPGNTGDEHRHHATGPSAADLQRVRDEASVLVTDFQDKLQQTLHLFKLKAAKQVAHELPDIAGKLLKTFSMELQKLADEAANQLKTGLTTTGTEVCKETSKQLAEIRHESLNGLVEEARAAIEKTLSDATRVLQDQSQALSQGGDAATRSVQATADEATAKLQVACEQMESSLLAEHQRRLTELAASSINADMAMRSIQTAVGEAETKIETLCDQMESSLAAGHQKRMAEAVASGRDAEAAIRSIDAAASEAAARLQAARENLESFLLADHQKRLAELAAASSNADTTLRAVQTAADEAAAKLWAAGEQIESSLAAEHKKRTEELAAASLKELAHKAQISVDGFQEQLESTLSAFKRKAAARIDEDIAKATAGLLERSAGQLQIQTDEIREKLLAELRDSGSTILEDTRRQLARVEKASHEVLNEAASVAAEKAVSHAAKSVEDQVHAAISRSAELAVERIGAERKKLYTEAELGVANYHKQLAALSLESIEGAQRRLDTHLETFRGQLHTAMESLEQRVLERAKKEFPRVTAGLVEDAAAGMEKKAGQIAEQIKGELQSSATSLGEKTRRQMMSETENSLRSLRESALDQSRGQIQQLIKEVAVAGRKEFEAEIEQSLRKQYRSAQAQIDDMARSSLERLRHAGAPVAATPAATSRTSQWLLILVALIPALLFLYLASRPTMRLRASPPAEFIGAYPEWTSSHQDVALRLGQAYWDWAALHLAPDHPYGTQLPEQPPVLFQVDGTGFPAGVDADVARMRYWQKLRQLWTNPQSWVKVKAWNRH